MFKGLFYFLRYMEQLRTYEVEIGSASPREEGSGMVRIMTIHKSKGLEFPVVFVSGLSRQFNLMDGNGPVLFHPGDGCRDGICGLIRPDPPCLSLKKGDPGADAEGDAGRRTSHPVCGDDPGAEKTDPHGDCEGGKNRKGAACGRHTGAAGEIVRENHTGAAGEIVGENHTGAERDRARKRRYAVVGKTSRGAKFYGLAAAASSETSGKESTFPRTGRRVWRNRGEKKTALAGRIYAKRGDAGGHFPR